MRLRFLGTGASEAYPVLFCACADCETARERGGPSVRRRSTLLVDDSLLIDFGPDINDAARAMGLRLYRVEHLLLTHAHGDHLAPYNFEYRRQRWAKQPLAPLHVYGSDATLERVRQIPQGLEETGLVLHPVAAGETFRAGPYRVTALRARHAPELQALFYTVERDGLAFLYATDTGAFYDETWALLERRAAEGVLLDAAIVEGTMGFQDLPPDAGHLTVPRCGEHHRQLRARGITRAGCRHLGTHFSPAAGAHPHEETASFLAQYGAEPAHDGMELILTTPGAVPPAPARA